MATRKTVQQRRTSIKTLTEDDQRLAEVPLACPDSIESFAEVYPIDVGIKKPLEHSKGTTYGFFFDCVEDVMIDIGYDLSIARVTVVYDFMKGHILDVTPDRPDLAVTGRWMFSPYGSRVLKECWKGENDDGYRTIGGDVVYSWGGNAFDVSYNDDHGLTNVLTHDEAENLGFLIMRKLSVVAEKSPFPLGRSQPSFSRTAIAANESFSIRRQLARHPQERICR